MPNACLNCVASFKSLCQVLQELGRYKLYHSVMWSKYVSHSREIILQLCPGSKFCFPYAYVQCMSDLCCNLQIPALNAVGGDAETRTVLQCDMV